MDQNKLDKIESLSWWYTNRSDGFLDFDEVLQLLRYRSISQKFRGHACLEIAPAQGVCTSKMKDVFTTLDLVDASQKLLDVIPDYPNVRKFRSLIEEFEPDRHYDTIVMDHLLEHLEFPVEALRRVGGWLNEGGVLIVGVPNALSFHRLIGQKMGLLPSPYDLNERDITLGHYRVYDRDSLRAHAEEAGLRVVEEDGVYLKFLSNKQSGEIFDEKQIEAFYQLGIDFKKYCAEIYIYCEKK
ncbi:MAG: class I SAM-dependent methyltransferase [Flavobacteriales bacterium]|nr:class I SAM-dependent methyltransferase [Flavobacteriales bacterium]